MPRAGLCWVLLSFGLVRCTVDQVNLEGKLCPCAEGYDCVDGRCWRAATSDAAADAPQPSCSEPPPLSSEQHLGCGRNHTCLLRDGELWCWGDNRRGQLGLGHQDVASGPQQVGAAEDWVYVSAGETHTCGIRNSSGFGGLHCWGGNDHGQLGLGDLDPHSSPTLVTDNVSFGAVAAGDMHTCALQDNGLLWCWGRQEGGAVGLGVIGPALSVPARVGEADAFVALAAGLGHNCAVRSDRRLLCWGHFECWQLGSREHELVPHPLDVGCWTRAAAGHGHSCAIDEQDRLLCWGSNEEGQLGLGFVNGGETSTLDGCNAFDVPQPVLPDTTWTTVAAGGLHTCAVSTSGELYCWGFNEQRQVAGSANLHEPAPLRVGTADDWAEVCAGLFHTCALNAAGEVFCVGSDESGQQGTGSSNEQLTRVPL